MKQEMQLDQVLPVELSGVDLAQLESHFRLAK